MHLAAHVGRRSALDSGRKQGMGELELSAGPDADGAGRFCWGQRLAVDHVERGPCERRGDEER